jgi:hypothetical protein
MRRVPLHAQNASTAQTILGPACADVDVVQPSDVPADDDREFFVAAWCLHPRFILDEKIIFIPEPCIHNPVEATLVELLGLRYLVRLRLVAFQTHRRPPQVVEGLAARMRMMDQMMAISTVSTLGWMMAAMVRGGEHFRRRRLRRSHR